MLDTPKPAQVEVKRRKTYAEEQGDTICELRDVKSMTFTEIAELLGVSKARASMAYHKHKKRLTEGYYEQLSSSNTKHEEMAMLKQSMSGMEMLKQAINQLRSERKTIVVAIGDYLDDPSGQFTIIHDLSKSEADFSHSMHDVIYALSCFVRNETTK